MLGVKNLRTKPLTLLILSVLLLSLVIPALLSEVKAEPMYTITINSDGTITSTRDNPPITRSEDTTYTLTSSFTGSITILRDNIHLDGAGYTITGTESGDGIYLNTVDNVQVTNTTLFDQNYAIHLIGSTHCLIAGNNIQTDPTQYDSAITAESHSDNNTIIQNTVTGDVSGISIYGSNYNLVTQNNVSANSNGFGLKFANDGAAFNNASFNQVTSGWYGFICESDVNNTVSDNIFSDVTIGFYADYSCNNTITNNQISCHNFGVVLQPATNTTVSNNIIHGASSLGIQIAAYYEDSTGNFITNNTIYSCHQGIYLASSPSYDSYCFSNIVSYNNLTSNDMSVYFYGSYDNEFFGNTISSDYDAFDFSTDYSYGNIIYANNILSGGINYETSQTNIWDFNGQGNYWGNYLSSYPSATEIGTSGIWNTPYTTVESPNSQDNYPLVRSAF